MKEPASAGKPIMSLGVPVWFHPHGWKIKVGKFSTKSGRLQLIIGGSAAQLKITRLPFPKIKGLLAEWKIVQSQQEKSSGSVIFSADQLRAAFGLTSDFGDLGQWLIDQYGAESASQGKYIRWKHFLNIPCPGTGRDGDPNISVELDFEIQNAIRQLLEKC